MSQTTHSQADPVASSDDPIEGTGYEFVRKLGEGGMGEVVEAVHRGLRKLVVIKLLHQRLAEDPRLVDRLRVEAQALASVSSPHLVSVTDIGTTPDGRPYFVMERLQGATLRQVLRQRGPIHPREAIAWTLQVLSGLEVAHAAGFIHRDIKLDNVFLCDRVAGEDPLVKVLDFGVAKVVQSAQSQFPAPKFPTEAGSLVGSPRYVSPEQVLHGTIDERTDVYGVGILLYHLLAGHPFAHHRDVTELLHAHVVEQPRRPSELAPSHQLPYILPDLDNAVLKALSKNPDDRHQSAAQFAEELRHVLARIPEVTKPLPEAPTTGDGTVIIPMHPVGRRAKANRPMETPPPTEADAYGNSSQPETHSYADEVAQRIEALNSEPGHTRPWPPPSSPAAFNLKLFLVIVLASTVVFTAILLALLRWAERLG